MMRKSILIVGVVVLSSVFVIPGLESLNAAEVESTTMTQQGVFPVLVPSGSYMRTCSSCSWRESFTYYTCTCVGNTPQPTTVDLANCPNFGSQTSFVTLTNVNGVLVCGS